ncbi:MAG: hypothetical protein QXJ64_03245 [Thermosphaera sp.]
MRFVTFKKYLEYVKTRKEVVIEDIVIRVSVKNKIREYQPRVIILGDHVETISIIEIC